MDGWRRTLDCLTLYDGLGPRPQLPRKGPLAYSNLFYLFITGADGRGHGTGAGYSLPPYPHYPTGTLPLPALYANSQVCPFAIASKAMVGTKEHGPGAEAGLVHGSVPSHAWTPD